MCWETEGITLEVKFESERGGIQAAFTLTHAAHFQRLCLRSQYRRLRSDLSVLMFVTIKWSMYQSLTWSRLSQTPHIHTRSNRFPEYQRNHHSRSTVVLMLDGDDGHVCLEKPCKFRSRTHPRPWATYVRSRAAYESDSGLIWKSVQSDLWNVNAEDLISVASDWRCETVTRVFEWIMCSDPLHHLLFISSPLIMTAPWRRRRRRVW